MLEQNERHVNLARFWVAFGVLSFSFFYYLTNAYATPIVGSWPQVQKDASRSGYTTDVLLPKANGYTKLWQVSLPPISSRVQPIIAQNMVFIPSNNGSVYAYVARQSSVGTPAGGTEVWSYASGGALVNSVAYHDKTGYPAGGVVFFGSTDGYIYAVQASDGTFIDKFATGGAIKTAPLIANDKIIIGSSDGKMYSFQLSNLGQGLKFYELWSRDVGTPIYDTAAYYNSRVFFGGMDSKGYALNESDGSIAWSVQLNGQGFRDRWTVAGGGKVFFTPMLRGNTKDALEAGTVMLGASANPVIYDKSWATQKAAFLTYLQNNPQMRPLRVLTDTTGAEPYLAPVLAAALGSQSAHPQVVLYPDQGTTTANVVYRRGYPGDPAQWGATTNDGLYVGKLVLSTGDIEEIDKCVAGGGHWENCGVFKSPLISDESVALTRSASVIYLDVARTTVGLNIDTQRTIGKVACYNESCEWHDYMENQKTEALTFTDWVAQGACSTGGGWRVSYCNVKSEVPGDGNDIKRPSPIVDNVMFILHYDTLAAVEGL